MFSHFSYVYVTEWPPIGKIAAHSAYDMFLWYKYLIVNLIFPTSIFGVGIFSGCAFSWPLPSCTLVKKWNGTIKEPNLVLVYGTPDQNRSKKSL